MSSALLTNSKWKRDGITEHAAIDVGLQVVTNSSFVKPTNRRPTYGVDRFEQAKQASFAIIFATLNSPWNGRPVSSSPLQQNIFASLSSARSSQLSIGWSKFFPRV